MTWASVVSSVMSFSSWNLRRHERVGTDRDEIQSIGNGRDVKEEMRREKERDVERRDLKEEM